MPSATITLYGIKTCDTCRKARQWLRSKGLDHRYHDLRTDGVDADMIGGWVARAGVDAILNRRGTTWRQLAPDLPAHLDEATARKLIFAHPTLIKRPVIEIGDELVVGFGSRQQQSILEAAGTPLAAEPESEAPRQGA